MKVFIEQVEAQWRGVNEYAAFRGFESLGYEIRPFVADELELLELDCETPVVAGIPVVWRALKKLSAQVPQLEPIPRDLEAFAGREFGLSSLGAIRQRVFDEAPPIFIKPRAGGGKLFEGQVVRAFGDLLQTVHLPDQTPVWWSQVVDFRGEFRGFVCNGELIGFRHYAGDFRWPIDFGPVEAAIQSWSELPRGCSMDWGTTGDGRTLLIEVNDGYSLGNYGLMPTLYANLLASRWREMTAHSAI